MLIYIDNNIIFTNKYAISEFNTFKIPENNGNIKIINGILYYLNKEGLLCKYSINNSNELINELNYIKNIIKLNINLNNLIIIYKYKEFIKLYFLEDKSSFKIPFNSLYAISKDSLDIIYLNNNIIYFYRNFKRIFFNPKINLLWIKNIKYISINKFNLIIAYNINLKIMKSAIMQIKNSSIDNKEINNKDIIIYHFKKEIKNIDLFKDLFLIKFKKEIKIFKKENKINIKDLLNKYLKRKENKRKENIKEINKLLNLLNIKKEYKKKQKEKEFFINYIITDKIYLITNKNNYYSFNNKLKLLNFNFNFGFIKTIFNYEFRIYKKKIFLNGFLLPKTCFLSLEFFIFKINNNYIALNILNNLISLKVFKNKLNFNNLILLKLSFFKINNILKFEKKINKTLFDFYIINNITYILTNNYIYIFENINLIGFFKLNIKESIYFFKDYLYLYFKNEKKIIKLNEKLFLEIKLEFKLTKIIFNSLDFMIFNKKINFNNQNKNIFQLLNIELIERNNKIKNIEKGTYKLKKLASKYKEKANKVLKKFK